ncbi:MAG: hypothetical protein Q9M17_08730 [Mariprofundus sp.]|nr:hypothetical protein [Mariprofundus sp.]
MMRKSFFLCVSLLMLCTGFTSVAVAAGENAQIGSETTVVNEHSSDVMRQFNEEKALAAERAISTNRKHQILFWMGGTLLCLVLLAAGFGVAMGIFGKDVFLWHVLSAGLATTLAIAHAVVAFVWFYPDRLL